MTDDALFRQIEESTKNFSRHQAGTLRSILHTSAAFIISNATSPMSEITISRSTPPLLDAPCRYLATKITPIISINWPTETTTVMITILATSCPSTLSFASFTAPMKPKLIPYFDSAFSKAGSYIAHQGSASVLRRPEVNKRLVFMYADSITTTKGGFKVMAASSFPLHNSSNASRSLFMSLTSPLEVILGSHVEHQLYCHLLCGLRNSDSIDSMHAPYAFGLIKALRALESKWEQLCYDIDKGSPCSEINYVQMRDSVVEVLGGPQPDLSNRIRFIFEKNDWGGILHKLWPNVRYVKCVTTGSMKHYYSKHKYFAGEISLLGGDYFSSECPVAINLDIKKPPDQTRFVMLPTTDILSSFRLIRPRTMLSLVKKLWKYRLGDIVRVVGFYNSSPLLEFVMRAPKNSFEIVTEGDLMAAMESFQLVMRNTMGLAIEIVDFTSSVDFDCSPKRLKIFIEAQDCDMILQDKLQGSDLRKCCSAVEDGLGSIYKVQRNNGEISPLSLSILKCGSFDRLLKLAIENGTPASQYKSPKIIRNPSIVDGLEEYVLVNITLD
ncbi:Major facilitator superfamily protein isoform 1 [Hibiscus syriacus]|uniref:Major facilitator superfamily protein isoform 1 n=1 Tax=Hibiscus syriacus TaxID=106335 RepID=A0A6A2WUM7_HIBSY|nr:Major facilitator superfamily protein isoform 1 [Hibiscus syriacus]